MASSNSLTITYVDGTEGHIPNSGLLSSICENVDLGWAAHSRSGHLGLAPNLEHVLCIGHVRVGATIYASDP